MFLNYTFPEPAAFTPAKTSMRADIAPHIHIAIDPDKGTIEAGQAENLVIRVDPAGHNPQWVELGLVLPSPEWARCSKIHLEFSAQAEKETQLRPCLRFAYDDGFKDMFAPEPHVISTGMKHDGVTFDLPPNLAHEARHMEFRIFFEPEENAVTFHTLAMTGSI